MQRRLLCSILALPLLALSACTDTAPLGESESAIAVIPRGSTCAQLGLGGQSFTLTGPVTGDYSVDGTNSLHFEYYDETATTFFFNNSTIKMTGVLVTVGDLTMMWELGVPGADAWGSLEGPSDPVTGELSPPEEVTFCYDHELYVQPSPYAQHQELATWTITATGPDGVVLVPGEAQVLDYAVTVSATTAGAGQLVEGPMFVYNSSPNTVTVGSVVTMVGAIAADVTCPVPAPFDMAPFTVVQCGFRADVPDTDDRNVVGSATVSHGLRVSTQEVVASFAENASTVTLDRCVDVRDDAAVYADHLLGTACSDGGEATFDFTVEVESATCGPFTLTSTASYQGHDTGTIGEATRTVSGDVACD